jgi:hypothetical protein
MERFREDPTGPHEVAAVLVVAADPATESLVGELVAFAGHRPLFDATMGAAGESVRRSRPAVALIDTALAPDVVQSCIDAARESGSSVVLMSSTSSESELAAEAASERVLHFALPGGPKPLRDVLEKALDATDVRPVTAIPKRLSGRKYAGSVHPSLCAAISTVARAQIAIIRAEAAPSDNLVLRNMQRDMVGQAVRTRDALRAAVTDYTKQLKRAEMQENETVHQVRETLMDCTALMGADAQMDVLLAESESWVRSAYRST